MWWIAVAAAAPQAGDVVFHRSRTEQSQFIALATGSPWTHTGVVFVVDGEPVVFEASADVRFTPLDAWAERAADGKIAVRRPLEAVSDADLAKLFTTATTWVGRRYDAAFAWSDDRLYCSELVHKLYTVALGRELSPLRTFASFDLSNPRVAAAARERWGARLPLDEVVVAPSDLYVALAPVCEGPVAECLR